MIFNVLIKNTLESLVDNVFRDKVFPVKGSVVYCDLGFGLAEHSGIYVGSNRIVHLDGSGLIECVSPGVFISRLNGLNGAISIYVSCVGGSAVGESNVAKRAVGMIGESRAYNVVLDNCHQFSSGCMTGNFDNSDNFLWMLKKTSQERIGSNTWRVWETGGGQY